jgi:hypothetical protein
VATTTRTKQKPREPVDHIHATALENAKRQAEAEANGGEPAVEEAKQPEPLLELKTALEPRPTVKIDDTHYEMYHRREFGIVAQHDLQVEGDEFDTLWDKKERLNSKQRQRLKTVLDAMFDKVLIAPPEVKNKLDDESKRAVVLTFIRAPLLMAELAAQKPETLEEEETDENPTWDT